MLDLTEEDLRVRMPDTIVKRHRGEYLNIFCFANQLTMHRFFDIITPRLRKLLTPPKAAIQENRETRRWRILFFSEIPVEDHAYFMDFQGLAIKSKKVE